MPPRLSRRTLLASAATPLLAAQAGADPPRKPRLLTQWGQRGPALGEFDIAIGLALTPQGHLLTTEFRNNRVQRFSPEGRFLAAFSVEPWPAGIAVAKDGTLFVSHFGVNNSGKDQITAYSPGGTLLRQWGRTGTRPGEFNCPGGLLIAPDGTLYVADQTNRRIQQFTPEGRFLRAWGEHGKGPGQFGGSVSPASRTGGPQFLALDRENRLYATEGEEGRIQCFTLEGRYLSHWGSNATEPGGFGGRPKNLPGPIGITVDRDGHLWISATNHRVQQFDRHGRFLQMLGDEESEAPGKFKTPHALAVDRHNHLYVCDTQNGRIQKFAL